MRTRIETGFLWAAALSPALALGDPSSNGDQMIKMYYDNAQDGVQVLLFPELCLTGATCGDMFLQKALYAGGEEALKRLLAATVGGDTLVVVGMPVYAMGRLYNCAVLLKGGEILGVVPQQDPSVHPDLPLGRIFAQAPQQPCRIDLAGQNVMFDKDLLVTLKPFGVTLGVLFGGDLFTRRAEMLCEKGAQCLLCLSSLAELLGRRDEMKQILRIKSRLLRCGILYAGAGLGESTGDLTFSGSCMAAEDGQMLMTTKGFENESVVMLCDFDTDILTAVRQKPQGGMPMGPISATFTAWHRPMLRRLPKNPFLQGADLSNILDMQCAGLQKRLQHIQCKKVVVNVSGGTDSALALLVCARTFEKMGLPSENIMALILPGFGSTAQALDNAEKLTRLLKVTTKTISVQAACLQHFEDIGHSPDAHDITFENAQARERTQIGMDMANKEKALFVGTGDMTELFLGFTTYGGDHLSMYALNAGIPKTVVQALLAYEGTQKPFLKEALDGILRIPPGPELLPLNEKGEQKQTAEGTVGYYALHDFFLYYTLKYGFTPKKLFMMAAETFEKDYDRAAVYQTLETFFKRMTAHQFKRSCSADGPAIYPLSLSPRGFFMMPSDMAPTAFLENLKALREELLDE